MKKTIKSNPRKKDLIFQGGLAVCVLGVVIMAVSHTIAWFTSSTQNSVEEVTLEVSASRAFDLSLDGENFGRDLKLKIIDEETEDNLNTLLNDVAPVISQNTSNGVTTQSLELYSPTKDDYSGEPITTNTTWEKSIKTNFVYDNDTNTYYVTNAQDNIAEYIEFDLWVRAETELDVYLGSESYVSPTYSGSDTNYNYAVYEVDEVYKAYDEKIYKEQNTIKGRIIEDYNNDKYVYSYSNSTYSLLAVYKTDGEYYDLKGNASSIAYKAAAKIFVDNTNSYTIEQGAKQDAKTKTTYYAPDGVSKKVVGIVETINGVTKYYSSEEDYENNVTTSNSKEFKIESISPYTYQENETTDEESDVISIVRVCRFSKNLSAGAMRVAFSEVDVDTGLNDNLKYVWNPQPNYKLTNAPNGAKVDIVSQNEDTYYYTTDGAGNYTKKSFTSELPGYVHSGLVQSTTDNPAEGESPLCSLTTPADKQSFCMKRLRVKVYLDGNDNESQNPLLSSSSSENGHIDIKLQFVSQYDNVIVEKQTENTATHTYTFAAHRSSEVEDGVVDYTNPAHTYTWKINNPNIGTITTSDGGKTATVTTTNWGVLVVYAEDETGRIGTYTITTNQLNVMYTSKPSDLKTYILTASYNGSIISENITYEVVSGDVTISGNEVTFVSGNFARIRVISSEGISIVNLSYSGGYE